MIPLDVLIGEACPSGRLVSPAGGSSDRELDSPPWLQSKRHDSANADSRFVVKATPEMGSGVPAKATHPTNVRTLWTKPVRREWDNMGFVAHVTEGTWEEPRQSDSSVGIRPVTGSCRRN